MSKMQVTVSDLSALIQAREDTRAELQLLALQAYEQWRHLEAKIQRLEERFEHSYEELSKEHVDRLRLDCPHSRSQPKDDSALETHRGSR